MTKLLDERNRSESKTHLDMIEQLAAQSGVPKTEVTKRYEAELDRMQSSTRIRTFLSVLVGRKVKEGLRQYPPANV